MGRRLSLDAYDTVGVTEAEVAAYGDDVRDAWEEREAEEMWAEVALLAHS
ncbi:hypothetical protein [Streptomyces scopuliridis]